MSDNEKQREKFLLHVRTSSALRIFLSSCLRGTVSDRNYARHFSLFTKVLFLFARNYCQICSVH